MTQLVIPERLRAETERKKEPSFYSWLGTASAVGLALLSAALYCAGRANREGYLFTLGFDPDQLRGDFHEITFWGFASSIPIIAAYIAVAAAMGFVSTIIWAGLYLAWSHAADRWPRLRKLSSQDADKAMNRRMKPYAKLLAYSSLALPLLYVLVGSYWIIFAARDKGTERGEKLLAELEADSPMAAAKHELQWIEISLHPEELGSFKGYRLACSESFCSIYEPDSKKGRRLVSMDRVLSMQIFDRRPPAPTAPTNQPPVRPPSPTAAAASASSFPSGTHLVGTSHP